jgi:hypothetical protein
MSTASHRMSTASHRMSTASPPHVCCWGTRFHPHPPHVGAISVFSARRRRLGVSASGIITEFAERTEWKVWRGGRNKGVPVFRRRRGAGRESGIGARGSGVPQGGTAIFRLWRFRVYTVRPFRFSAGRSILLGGGLIFLQSGLRVANVSWESKRFERSFRFLALGGGLGQDGAA